MLWLIGWMAVALYAAYIFGAVAARMGAAESTQPGDRAPGNSSLLA